MNHEQWWGIWLLPNDYLVGTCCWVWMNHVTHANESWRDSRHTYVWITNCDGGYGCCHGSASVVLVVVWQDPSIFVTWRIHIYTIHEQWWGIWLLPFEYLRDTCCWVTCDMTHPYLRRDAFTYMTHDMTHPYLRRDAFTYMTHDMTHPYLRRDAFTYMTRAMTHPYLRRDAFTYMTRARTHPYLRHEALHVANIIWVPRCDLV